MRIPEDQTRQRLENVAVQGARSNAFTLYHVETQNYICRTIDESHKTSQGSDLYIDEGLCAFLSLACKVLCAVRENERRVEQERQRKAKGTENFTTQAWNLKVESPEETEESLQEAGVVKLERGVKRQNEERGNEQYDVKRVKRM